MLSPSSPSPIVTEHGFPEDSAISLPSTPVIPPVLPPVLPPTPVCIRKAVTFSSTASVTTSTSDMDSASRQHTATSTSPSPADERTAIASSQSASSIFSYGISQNGTGREDNRSPTPDEPEEEEEEDHHGFFGRLGAIELENKGSVARDHLALERTFLAWLRTSLAFASIGIAITQLFRLNSATAPQSNKEILSAIGKPLGAMFLAIAILVLLLGTNRYYESQAWLLKGKFPASRGSVFLLTLVASSLIIASLVIVLVVSPSQSEL